MLGAIFLVFYLMGLAFKELFEMIGQAIEAASRREAVRAKRRRQLDAFLSDTSDRVPKGYGRKERLALLFLCVAEMVDVESDHVPGTWLSVRRVEEILQKGFAWSRQETESALVSLQTQRIIEPKERGTRPRHICILYGAYDQLPRPGVNRKEVIEQLEQFA